MPTAEIAYLSGEVQSLRSAMTQNDTMMRRLSERLAENTAAIQKVGKDVSDVKTILQLGRALSTFAAGVRWVVVWLTPIAVFLGGLYAFILWLMGKGPFPH